ncbi:hexokinase-4-like [Littorina saxatilis]|uniref:hexokinase-4-like n=1 Tax=Littorina saxatilis TaxID=31220 RepID=UPI0038B50ED9
MIWLVVLLIIPAAAALLMFFLYRRRRSRNRQSNSLEDTSVDVPLIAGQKPVFSQMTDKKLEEFVKGFQLSTQDCRDVMHHIEKQMDICHTDTGVYRRPLPQKKVTVNSAFLVVDLGSGNLKIQLVKFKANKKTDVRFHHYNIPQNTRQSTSIQLFGFIEDCVRKFVIAHDMLGKNYRVAFVFSFPCKHSPDLSQAVLTKWTKEFHCGGFGNRDLRELLQQALPQDKMACILDVKIVVNDAVGALVAAAHDDPSCKLSLVVGNGFYSCYINEQGGNGTQMVNIGRLARHRYVSIFAANVRRLNDGHDNRCNC